MGRSSTTAALVLGLGVAVSACAVPVANNLDEGEANRVVVTLDQAGIDASKEADPGAEGRFRVNVPRDDAARALATMADEQLPRAKAHGVLDATDRGQLVPSQAAEHAQLVAGLAGDLERTLADAPGVLSARVHLNVPARDPLRDGPAPKATASVLVEHRGTTPPIAPESIQRLVAGGAPGLSPADVTVVFVPHPPRAQGSRLELGHVGPIAVARGSVTLLKAALASLVALVLLFAGLTLGLYTRLTRLRRERDDEGQKVAARVAVAPRTVPPAAPAR
jgi:type III secretion protein J